MKKLRIGVVGAGYISRNYHCPALKRLTQKFPQLELAAICDIREECARELAQIFGFSSYYVSVADMLAREALDGAYLLVEYTFMKDVALEFINHGGIPLFLEKPPGKSSAEVRELIGQASAHGTTCMVALNRRFIPLAKRMKSLIGELDGPPQIIEAQMFRTRRVEEAFAYGTAVHAVDLMRYLGGEVSEVRVEKLSLPGNSSFSYQVGFTFKSGLLGRLSILPEVGFEAERYTIHGHNSTIQLEAPLEWTIDYPGRILFFKGRDIHFIQDNRILPETMRDSLEITGFLGESFHFLESLTTGRKPGPSLEECLQSIEIVEAIQEGKNIRPE